MTLRPLRALRRAASLAAEAVGFGGGGFFFGAPCAAARLAASSKQETSSLVRPMVEKGGKGRVPGTSGSLQGWCLAWKAPIDGRSVARIDAVQGTDRYGWYGRERHR